jgi:hypothetical protein
MSDAPTAEVAAIATDRDQSEGRRIEALRAIGGQLGRPAVYAAIQVLNEDGRSAALGAAAIDALSLQMMFGDLDHGAHAALMDELQKALSDKDIEVRQGALRVLASHRDPVLIQKLVAALDAPSGATIAPIDAINGLVVAGAAHRHTASIRNYINAGESKVRASAVVALASDAESRPMIAKLLADQGQPEQVRAAAIRSLTIGGADSALLFVDVLKNSKESPELRERAAGALTATVETYGAALGKSQLDVISSELKKVDATIAPAAGPALRATEALREKM